ncbi:hypothetical protein BU251_02530 [Candidatus Velamenicoccus archaeovorus]|uniref:Uncharacterized protein n=1 Tax=Velamenicoccus archaeovorus TaxID=1930593 RepID=A0A410P3B1_VELA1|nr:hypothetical protein [Candidatus Velamenicoccus archaeovorus]QAT16685.1 hypothetical protein BU251_02530 [Candidatus Velamenicoccus archaeovorus]
MSIYYGKLSRKVGKEGKEYFVGRAGGIPVRAAWGKKKEDDICIFLDVDRINFLAKGEKANGAGEEAGAGAEENQA